MQPVAQRLYSDRRRPARRFIDILQVNLGAYCNHARVPWHVDAGPTHKEIMPLETVQFVLGCRASTNISTLDITGGRRSQIAISSLAQVKNSPITGGDHGYGCKAGCASSGGGALMA